MRFSKAFIPTIKEVPKDAVDASHVLLLRGGFIRMVGSGIYEMLPIGQRVLKKVMQIIREEMEASEAQEILMPALLPASYFKETGRWDVYGPVLMRMKDRKGGDYHLGPTHEEIVTDMIRRDLKSYKQLPQILFQIQMKYRDEPRPRAGLMRCREFMMKDAYSFDVSEEKAFASYELMRDTYHRIFKRLGLDYRIVDADPGAIGGSTSAEFQILAHSGEDKIVACTECDYAANVEIAEAKVEEVAAPATLATLEKVATPDTKTIEQVVGFFDGITAANTIKALVYMTVAEEPALVMALVRGDHDVNEIKLARYLGIDEVRLATDEEVQAQLGTPIGYVGPVDAKDSKEDIRIVADHVIAQTHDAVCGAGDGHHYRGANHGRDFEAEFAHLRVVGDGDHCPRCGGPLKSYRGIEGGHIFVLGTRYSSDMKAHFLDENGKSKPVVMGCYGIGVTRLMASAIEQNHDDHGIQWPMPIAPFQVTVLALGKQAEIHEAATTVYEQLKAAGVEVLLDDRKDRPGPKFKDAELIGIPLQVRVGKGVAEGVVELKTRATGEDEKFPMDQIASVVVERVKAAGGVLRR